MIDILSYKLGMNRGGGGSDIPEVTPEDEGKAMQVVDGEWVEIKDGNEVAY